MSVSNAEKEVLVRGTNSASAGEAATKQGWVCPYCDYKQDWAHDFMARTRASYGAGLIPPMRRQRICDDEELAMVQEQLTFIEHALATLRRQVTNPRNF